MRSVIISHELCAYKHHIVGDALGEVFREARCVTLAGIVSIVVSGDLISEKGIHWHPELSIAIKW